MTPGDIQNGRVGPDPTAGAKTVAGAPRAQNTDPRPRNVPNRNHSGQRCAALATVFDPAVGSGPTRPFWISPGVIGRARCAGVASLLSPNAPTPGPRRQLSHIAYLTGRRHGIGVKSARGLASASEFSKGIYCRLAVRAEGTHVLEKIR